MSRLRVAPDGPKKTSRDNQFVPLRHYLCHRPERAPVSRERLRPAWPSIKRSCAPTAPDGCRCSKACSKIPQFRPRRPANTRIGASARNAAHRSHDPELAHVDATAMPPSRARARQKCWPPPGPRPMSCSAAPKPARRPRIRFKALARGSRRDERNGRRPQRSRKYPFAAGRRRRTTTRRAMQSDDVGHATRCRRRATTCATCRQCRRRVDRGKMATIRKATGTVGRALDHRAANRMNRLAPSEPRYRCGHAGPDAESLTPPPSSIAWARSRICGRTTYRADDGDGSAAAARWFDPERI